MTNDGSASPAAQMSIRIENLYYTTASARASTSKWLLWGGVSPLAGGNPPSLSGRPNAAGIGGDAFNAKNCTGE